MIVCVVSLVDQVLPVEEEEIRSIVSPIQIVVKPEAVIVGVAGSGFTVTIAVDVGEEQPFWTTFREIVFPELTVMDCVVSPVDQTLFVAEEEVSTTEPPSQKVVGPPGVMVAADGTGFTVTEVVDEVAEQPAWVTVTK